MKNIFWLLSLLFCFVSFTNAEAQIVTDPQLNQSLITFQQNFSQFIAQNPALSNGSSPPITVAGTTKRIEYNLQFQGSYSIVYNSIEFLPTNPISSNRFVTKLNIQSINLSGSSNLLIKDKKGRDFSLQCPDNRFSISPVVFTAEITAGSGQTSISSPRVNFDPKTISVMIPCLEERRPGSEFWAEDEGVVLVDSFGKVIVKVVEQNGMPSQATLSRVSSAIRASVQQPNSSVSNAAAGTILTTGTTASISASSPCAAAVMASAQAVVADLVAISSQAQSQGFNVALQQFLTIVRTILPTLNQPSQATIQKFVTDVNQAISASSPGGTTITPAEQSILVVDFYNLVLSTGITTSQLQAIESSLIAVLNTLSGISTAQLQTDLRALIDNARNCLK
ncbi:MAG: hypothetical protein JNN15_15920 [Blastocatellia bacterium]|nr:hypothetical protein [Blastocatellia bacterium]